VKQDSEAIRQSENGTQKKGGRDPCLRSRRQCSR